MDPISLRIDNQERMVNMLNDQEISPTNYMLAFLRQRAWKLPEQTVTIPNIIPEVDPAIEAVSPFKLWQTEWNQWGKDSAFASEL